MRQTTEHRGYPARPTVVYPYGFTLIEVVVAVAILGIVLVAFVGFSMNAYQWGQNLVTRSMAQNLAELSGEQIAGMSITEITSMVSTSSASSTNPDFPLNGTTWADDLTTHGVVLQSPGTYFVRVPGEFLVTGITSFFPQNASQVDLPSNPNGDIATLDARSSEFAKSESPEQEDLTSAFGFALPDTPSGYSAYKYTVAPNIMVEPVKHVDLLATVTWDSAVVLFKGEFPRFLREITIKRLDSGTSSDATQVRYSYTVNVIWLFSGKRQMVSVTGERSGVY